MHKAKKTNESRFSENFILPHRSMSCLNIEHHYPKNFVPTLKPKTLFDNPSPMCLGNLHDSSLILEKVNLYEGIR